MARIRWKGKLSDEEIGQRVKQIRKNAIENSIWPAIPSRAFGTYAVGDQKAHSHVSWEKFKGSFETSDQMHSEMVAIDAMLNGRQVKEGTRTKQVAWRLTEDGVVGIDDTGTERAIGTGHFWTDEPHCGFCTVMMRVLGLPFRDGMATRGNFNYAEHLDYPLPAQIKRDPVILGRLLGGLLHDGDADEAIGQVVEEIDVLLGTPSTEWALEIDGGYVSIAGSTGDVTLTWDDVRKRTIDAGSLGYGISALDYLWKLGFRAIYEACK